MEFSWRTNGVRRVGGEFLWVGRSNGLGEWNKANAYCPRDVDTQGDDQGIQRATEEPMEMPTTQNRETTLTLKNKRLRFLET